MLKKIGILFVLLCALCGVSASEVGGGSGGGGSAGPGGGSGCSVRIIGTRCFFSRETLDGIVIENGVIKKIKSWSELLMQKRVRQSTSGLSYDYAYLLPSKINAFFALPNWPDFAEDTCGDNRVRTSLLTCLIGSHFNGKGHDTYGASLKDVIIDILKAFKGDALGRVVNACAKESDSPLILAILRGRAAIAEVLLKNGANVSDKVVCTGNCHKTPVHKNTIPQLLEIEAIKKDLMKDDIVAYNYLRNRCGLAEVPIGTATVDDDRGGEDGYVDVVTVSDSEDNGAAGVGGGSAGAGGGSAGPGGGNGGDSRKKPRVK